VASLGCLVSRHWYAHVTLAPSSLVYFDISLVLLSVLSSEERWLRVSAGGTAAFAVRELALIVLFRAIFWFLCISSATCGLGLFLSVVPLHPYPDRVLSTESLKVSSRNSARHSRRWKHLSRVGLHTSHLCRRKTSLHERVQHTSAAKVVH